jgi:hypothetical protein
MKAIVKQFKQLLLIVVFLRFIAPAFAQHNSKPVSEKRKVFYQLLKDADLKFVYPSGFRELSPVDDEDYSYDFAMELPGHDFEVWLQVKPGVQNWASYEHARHNNHFELANPDSLYTDMGKADAMSLGADNNFLVRTMPPEVLERYNADAGKSYLINLADLEITKHYKYALIVALQKYHMGTVVAVYFTNHCLQFISPTTN